MLNQILSIVTTFFIAIIILSLFCDWIDGLNKEK
jgi:hypothetical protein